MQSLFFEDEIILLLGYIAFSICCAIYMGFATKILWNKFVFPLGVRRITTAWAIGLSCVSMLLFPVDPMGNANDESFLTLTSLITTAIIYFAAITFVLITGWVASFFMPRSTRL